MAEIGYALNHANIKPGGIASWQIKMGTDIGHYSFGPLSDAKVNVKTMFDPDSYGRQKPYGLDVNATAKTFNTSKTTVLELLGKLGVTYANQIITAVNGQKFSGQLGFSWRLVCEGGMAKRRYLELFADGQLLIDHATYDDLGVLLAASPTVGAPAGGDSLNGWDATTASRAPAAFKSVTIAVDGDSEDVGSIRNERLIVTGVGSKDNYGRSTVQKIQVEVEFDMRQTSAELALMVAPSVDTGFAYAITLADGAILTLSTDLGFHFEYDSLGSINDEAFIKVTGGGFVLPTAWAGIVS